MWRARQRLPFTGAGYPVIETLVSDDSGRVEHKLIDHSKLELPSVETTDLSLLIKAGVNLKEVNTKILGSKEIVVDMSPVEEVLNNEEGVDNNEN